MPTSPPVSNFPSRTTNVHPIITRAKVGIHKLKTYLNALVDNPIIKPTTLKQALIDPLWRASMQLEYDALLRKQYKETGTSPNR